MAQIISRHTSLRDDSQQGDKRRENTNFYVNCIIKTKQKIDDTRHEICKKIIIVD